ncbi:MAG: DUF5717 family protein, partial [Clostridium sp.]|nr:DUF5717 family protein [Clostridium sp.]
VYSGYTYEDSFRITSPPGQLTSGYCISSDSRLTLLTRKFAGYEEEIHYSFNAACLEEGDAVQGTIDVVSNQGEYSLPFTVTVERAQHSSSIGNIRNLFHFANLAKSNWKEALTLFYHEEFHHILSGNEIVFRELYRGLSASPYNESNLDEFLINTHKKVRMEYLTDQTLFELQNPDGVVELAVEIGRNGWGYTHLSIETSSDFLFTQKNELTEDDFLGHYTRLPFYIDSDLLTVGKNVAKLRLYTPYLKLMNKPLCVTVVVQKEDKTSELTHQNETSRREERHILFQLMDSYLNMRLKKMQKIAWQKEAAVLIERLRAIDDGNVAAKLFCAQLLITQDRTHEARWILEQAQRRLMQLRDPSRNLLEAYNLYLSSLLTTDESVVEKATRDVENLYEQDRSAHQVAWLLLYLSKSYNQNPAKKWDFLAAQLGDTSNNPLLTCEALLIMNANPTFLRKLTNFELHVLIFGAKRGALSAEVMEQVLYLSGRMKGYDPKLYTLLRICYMQNPQIRLLKEICVVLIKGGKRTSQYFKWFKLGVEQELHITKLYEHFMLTLPIDTAYTQIPTLLSTPPQRKVDLTLPKSVLLYYSYPHQLDVKHSAFLYLAVAKQKNEDPDLFLSYRDRIEAFVTQQICIDYPSTHPALPALIALYEEFLTPQMIDQDAARVLSKLLFLHEIHTHINGLCQVVVCQPGNLERQIYPINGDTAVVPIYAPQSTILFEDEQECVYADGISYDKTNLSLSASFLPYTLTFTEHSSAFLLALLAKYPQVSEWSSDLAGHFVTLSRDQTIESKLRAQIICQVLQYYHDRDDVKSLGDYLALLNPQILDASQKKETHKYMLLCEKNQQAYDWVAAYGPEDFDEKVLLHLCSRQIAQADFVKDALTTAMARIVFRRGKYDLNILQYLSLYINSTLTEMMQIWRAAQSFEADCYRLSERILLQTLYTHADTMQMIEVLRYYISQGARSDVLEAFLTQCAYDYFAKDKQTDPTIFREILQMFLRKDEVNKACKLAFLKYIAYLSEQSQDTPEVFDKSHAAHEAVTCFLTDMMSEGIHLSFFRNLRGFDAILSPMADKSIVEYRTRGDYPLRIHYVLLHETGEAGEYQRVEMKRVIGRVYIQEFVLFFGEKVQYHIVELADGEETLLDRGELVYMQDLDKPLLSRYDLINEIITHKVIGDYETVAKNYQEFRYKDHAAETLFHLLS